MKIVFFGTPDFSVPTLKILANIKDVEIIMVITQPDKPAGRKKIPTQPSVKICAKELGLKIFQPKNEKELFEILKPLKIDLFIVIAYGMILSKKILQIPKYGAINIHASLLPKYRGASPIQESLLNGDAETGISIIKMDEKMDHGDVILIKRIPIEEKDNQTTLSKKLANLSGVIMPFVIHDFMSGHLVPLPQNDNKATYCRKIKKEDGKINWNKSAEEIKNMIRAYNPWPSVYTIIKGKKIKILETDVSKENFSPGEYKLEKNTLAIGTKNGSIIPKKVQLEGKKEMKINDFINGYKNLFL